MFVHELRMAVAAQENAEIVEPGDISLKLHSIDQKNRDGRFAFAHSVQERVLQILLFVGHGETALFWLAPASSGGEVSIVAFAGNRQVFGGPSKSTDAPGL